MGTHKKIVNFFDTEDALEIANKLRAMTTDSLYNTESSYSADASRYPNNLIPFVDKHMNYLYGHPSLNPYQYLANIRLMTRKKKV